ncbi:MAG: ABC transporter ATP-binding protein [Beijerinckiaceae bacterium]
MTAALAVDDLDVKTSVGRKLVCGAAFTLDAGQILVILGESGSGKSLLAQAIMGNLPPGLASSGSVRLMGEEVSKLAPSALQALWGRKISLLPQEPWVALNPLMRADAQVAEVHALVRGASWPEAKQSALTALRRLGLGGAERHLSFRLSGGMAQRVALAAAEAAAAPVLIADEPTKGLDADRREDVAALLRAQAAAGAAVVVITHDIGLAERLGGTMMVMLEAEIVERGETASVLSNPQHPYSRKLLAADPARWVPAARSSDGAAIIEATSLGKSLGGRKLFGGLDLTLHAGAITAATGPSGCGKTTLGNVLLGLMSADSGRMTRINATQHRFQKIWQDPVAAFAPRATLQTALDDVARRHGLEIGIAETLLACMRISPELLARRPDQVSGGELQRIALARALMVDPVFLFADEATSRLDPVTQQEVMELLRDVVAERGLAVLMVTHDHDLARGMAGNVISMNLEVAAGSTLVN